MLTLIAENFERFLAADDGKPITMLNLLRFRPDGGRERYFEYLKMAGLLFHATALQSHSYAMVKQLCLQRRDNLGMPSPWYGPTRRAFADILSDLDYAVADPVRKTALVESVLQPIDAVSI